MDKTRSETIKQASFNLNNPDHIQLIDEHIKCFAKALQVMQTHEQKIIYSLAMSSACWAGSLIFPLTTLGYLSTGLTGYFIAKAEQDYKSYCNAFSNLKMTYDWAMGRSTGNHNAKMQNKTIQELILTIGPWLSNESLRTWEDIGSEKTNNTKDNQTNNQNWGSYFMSFAPTFRSKQEPEQFEKMLNNLSSEHNSWYQRTVRYTVYGENSNFSLFASKLADPLVNKIANDICNSAINQRN